MTVTIARDSVVKEYGPSTLDVELAKAQLIHDVSLSAGFVAPSVLDVDRSRGTIRYERVDCSLSLRDVVSDSSRPNRSVLEVISRVSACLGAIHQIEPPENAVKAERSQLLERALRRRPESGRKLGPSFLQHGDFGFTNIFVDSVGQITIIDPSPNGYTSIHALNVDVPELDLAILLSHFIGRSSSPTVVVRCALQGKSMVEAAIDGYETAGTAIDLARLNRFTRSSVDAYVDYRSRLGGLSRHKTLRFISAALSRNLP